MKMLDYKYSVVQYFQWLQRVVDFAKKEYGAEVELLAEEDAFIYEYKRKKVVVKGNTPPRDKLYILLHEVGHLSRIFENVSDSTFFMDKAHNRNIKEKTMTIMEEVLAWQKAEDIAKRLDINIESDAWKRLISKSMLKYIQWINEEI